MECHWIWLICTNKGHSKALLEIKKEAWIQLVRERHTSENDHETMWVSNSSKKWYFYSILLEYIKIYWCFLAGKGHRPESRKATNGCECASAHTTFSFASLFSYSFFKFYLFFYLLFTHERPVFSGCETIRFSYSGSLSILVRRT